MKKSSYFPSGSGQKFSWDEAMKRLENAPKITVTREQLFGPPTLEERVKMLEDVYQNALAASKKETEALAKRILNLESQVADLQLQLGNARIAEASKVDEGVPSSTFTLGKKR